MTFSNMSDREFITEVKFQYYSTDMLTPKTVEELFKRFEVNASSEYRGATVQELHNEIDELRAQLNAIEHEHIDNCSKV